MISKAFFIVPAVWVVVAIVVLTSAVVLLSLQTGALSCTYPFIVNNSVATKTGIMMYCFIFLIFIL